MEPTYEELKAKLASLEADKAKPKELAMKVSEKGGLSVYGLGRFPVTLYCGQWLRLIGYIKQVHAYIIEHWDQFEHKDGEVKPESIN